MSSFFNTPITLPPTIQQLSLVQLVLRALTESGTTANRPTANLWTGRMYFDTTLGIPVWNNGTDWVDATGASV